MSLSADQRDLRDVSRSYLAQSASSTVVRRMAEQGAALDPGYWPQLAALGWTSFLVPEELGGGSLGINPYADLALIAAESGRHVAPGPFLSANVVASALAGAEGAPDRRLLTGIVDGSVVPTWAVAEGTGTFALAEVSTTAIERSGGYELNGTKRFVESAPEADVILVVARAEGGGLVQILIDAHAAGVTIRPLKALDPSRHYADVELVDVAVGGDAVVNAGESSEKQLGGLLDLAVFLQCAELVGLMTRVFELTIDWVQNRAAFGRTIGSYQALKHRLADEKLWLEASLGLVDGLAAALGGQDADISRLASVAKAHIGDHAVDLVQESVQLHGGIGVTWEHDLHLYLRRATLQRSLFGSPIQHRDRLCTLAGI